MPINEDKFTDVQIRTIGANQTPEERLLWTLLQKMHRKDLSPARQHQLESLIPGWTWKRTPDEKKLFSLLSARGKKTLRAGSIPAAFLGNETVIDYKDGIRISMNGYYSQVPFTVVEIG